MPPFNNKTPDLFANQSEEQINASLVKDVHETFRDLSKDVLSAKITQHQMFKESAAEGGPSSVNESIIVALEICKLGYRELSRRVGVGRKHLVGMIEGRLELTSEVRQKIQDVLHEKRPDMYD
jgi:hypothetical protein